MDLTRLEAAAAALESLPEDDGAADYVGRLDKVIRTLQGHRKTIMDELPGPVSGNSYRIVEERFSERSYNTTRIVHDFNQAGLTLGDLIDADIARISWQWTNLRNAAIKEDIGLRIAGHELDGPDEVEHVGENWKTRYKVEGIK